LTEGGKALRVGRDSEESAVHPESLASLADAGEGIDMEGERNSILKPGKNCWRIEKVRRVSFLIDAAEYFEALCAAIEQAGSSIYIAGWDIDSRVLLLPSQHGSGVSLKLGELINSKVAQTPGLQVHLLIWDFAMIYAAQREWLPFFASNWKAGNGIHFHFDGEHPMGASHHQKFVVIDNALAFCGGVDLTGNRWDTSEHQIHDPRRINPAGSLYGPFHDAQMMVEGEVAAVLGELFRQRWFDATGENIRSSPVREPAGFWPQNKRVDLADTMVAVARTLPAYKGRPEVREIEALYKDAIAAAQKYIYIENQYFTSAAVIDALHKCLAKEKGPEVVLVLPYESDGWLARSTMDAIRSRVGNDLRKADSHHRLRIVHPVLDESGSPLFVHSKVMIVDDRFATIGSANLSNRSMGFDSECNLAVEAVEDQRAGKAPALLRNRLVAEHLGATSNEVAQAMARYDSLIKTIAALGDRGRTLKELGCKNAVSLDGVKLVQDLSLVDPEEPTRIDCIFDQFVHEPDEPSKARLFTKIGLLAFILIGMAAAWRWTPLADIINIERLATTAAGLKGSSVLPLLTVGTYVIGSFVMIPVSLLIGATAILFPTIWGVVYALLGCLLSSAANYFVGLKLGKNAVRKLAGPKLNRLSKKLAKDGWLAVMLIRNLPVAPFTVVNMIAGASHIKFKDFLLGTAIGMAPGIVAIVLFADRLLAAFAEPGWLNAILAAAAAAVVAAGIWWVGKRISQEEQSERV